MLLQYVPAVAYASCLAWPKIAWEQEYDVAWSLGICAWVAYLQGLELGLQLNNNGRLLRAGLRCCNESRQAVRVTRLQCSLHIDQQNVALQDRV